MMFTRLSLDLPEDFALLPMVRHVVRQVLISFHVSQQDTDDVELLVGELTANAARHAHSGLDYRIEVEIRDDLAVIVVSDRGQGFSWVDIAPPGTIRADKRDSDISERFGGWGIPIIEGLADRVEYCSNKPHGTTARVEKRLTIASP